MSIFLYDVLREVLVFGKGVSVLFKILLFYSTQSTSNQTMNLVNCKLEEKEEFIN